ncbi:MAG TPA: hypothetical protein VNW92_18540, partial [Polyangiaceae bacterium]|nr:hypothetical protein [Polyangiaceae bacterium]
MARVFLKLASERLFLGILALALFLPLCLSRTNETVFLGLPLITSGDEPHYLVMINSLINDGDLDLDNDYLSARQGSLETGRRRAGAPLDRHVEYYAADGTPYQWSDVFEYPKDDPARPGEASLVPRLKPGAKQDFSGHPQYSQHPPGLALLLAPVLYPVRGTRWVEHLAVLWAALATFVMALALRELFRSVSSDRGVVNAATIVTVLGSPLWHYGRMLFTEPWLTLCAVAALALVLRRQAYFLAGSCLALGMQMKPPFALLAVPLLVDRLWQRDVRRLLLFALPIVGSAALVLAENRHFFGAPLRSAQPWVNGNLLEGMLGLLLSWNHGLIPFAPAVLVALFGWKDVFRTHRRQAWLCAGTFASYYLLMSLWPVWRGGYCYGPRLILPIIPFAFLGIIRVFESLPSRSARFQRGAAAICGLSLGISAAGALVHLAFWNNHPLIAPFILLAQHV